MKINYYNDGGGKNQGYWSMIHSDGVWSMIHCDSDINSCSNDNND
jgi:hypothetical protein